MPPDLSRVSGAPEPHAEFASLTKRQLHAWADALLACDALSVQRCVDFVTADTMGVWHGRARAMMCRRLKHCALAPAQRTALVEAITQRLARGMFSEQYRDQLRLALHLDLQRTLAVCRDCLASGKPHVRRYAQWALAVRQERDASAVPQPPAPP